MKLNKSMLNFMWLVGSSIAIKGVGVLRESVVAYSVGNTMEFATFNMLRSLVDFFLAFVIGVPILESILVPKYANLYLTNNRLSFQPVWNQTIKVSKYLFACCLIVLAGISFFKTGFIGKESIYWIFLFSLYLSLSLSNGILFSILKTVGNFQKYSTQSLYNALILLVLIFVLIPIIGLKAILISSILTIVFSSTLLKNTLRHNFRSSSHNEGVIQMSDLNFYKLISVNHAIFVGFTGRFLISFENDYQINLYQYSFIIISSFMMIVVSNISSIILYRSSTTNNATIWKTVSVTLLITIIINLILYFFGDQIISLLYQRGKFTSQDTQDTFEFLKIFLIPYSVFSLTQVMIQPFLHRNSLQEHSEETVLKRIGQIIFISIAISLIIGFTITSVKNSVIVFLHLSSFSIFIYLGARFKELSYRKTF